MSEGAMRVYVEAFTHCNFVRIPAIQHGFATEHLYVYVYDREGPDATQCIPGVVRIWPKTYTVEIIFNGSERDPDTHFFREYLLPPQSGIVAIHGPTPAIPSPADAPLRLHQRHCEALEELLDTLGCDPWNVEAEFLDAITIDGTFTIEELQAITTFFTTIRSEYLGP